MKFAILLGIVLLGGAAFGAETATAYTALRVVGKAKGKSALSKVVELRGRNGAPQPAVWKIVLSEPGARGGVREIEVQRGQVISERTPVTQGPIGEPMDFNRLNLDSEGVFTLVDQEMKQGGVPFDRLDYRLRSGTGNGAPVWTADIFDGRRGQVGTMQIAADTGTVLSRSKTAPSREVQSDQEYARNNPPPRVVESDNVYHGDSRAPVGENRHSQPGEPFRGVGDFFHRLGKRMQRRAVSLENFFTGKD